MLFWTILILGSVILGVLAGLIKWRYSWVIVILVPIAIIHLLNSYYDSIAVDPHYLQPVHNLMSYFYVGVPSATIALITYLGVRDWIKKRNVDDS